MTLARSAETACTVLFAPGNRPERFAKAAEAGADLVVIDLEDSVPPAEKGVARRNAMEWLAAGNTAAVRINAVGTKWHPADVAAIAVHDSVVMVPKAESAADLTRLAAHLSRQSGVLALVETAAGVLRAQAIAAAPGVRRLVFGSLDLAAQLSVDPTDSLALAASRSALVLASAAAGIAPPVDGVTGDLANEKRLRQETAHARRLGFTGKLCIHPRQVGLVDKMLRPTAEEEAWARSVADAETDRPAYL